MKITHIDVMELKPRRDKQWRPIVCRINTDEGIYGYGEAAMAYGVGASAAFGMIKDLAGNIIGMLRRLMASEILPKGWEGKLSSCTPQFNSLTRNEPKGQGDREQESKAEIVRNGRSIGGSARTE